jgi:hypothetical protein
LNGVIQKANSSFSVSGSQITFLPSSGTLSSSDSIDFILILGSVNDVGVATTVSDSAITKNKLNLISTSGSPGLEVKGDGSSENGTIQLNCSQNSHGVKLSSPAHSSGQSYEMILPTTNITAGKFLKVDSVSGSGATGIGQLSFASAGGITEADQWRLTANISSNISPISANLERVDNTGFGYIGTGMSVSSGIWTFPSTGIYLIEVIGGYQTVSNDNVVISIEVTTDNSTFTQVAIADESSAGNLAGRGVCKFLFDVTDTANCKVKFNALSINSGSLIMGNTDRNDTHFTFIRLGDT